MAGEEKIPERFGRALQKMTKLFYTDNGLLSSPHTDKLQEAVYILVGIFDRLGL